MYRIQRHIRMHNRLLCRNGWKHRFQRLLPTGNQLFQWQLFPIQNDRGIVHRGTDQGIFQALRGTYPLLSAPTQSMQPMEQKSGVAADIIIESKSRSYCRSTYVPHTPPYRLHVPQTQSLPRRIGSAWTLGQAVLAHAANPEADSHY